MSIREFAAGWSAAMEYLNPANSIGMDEATRRAFAAVDAILDARRKTDARLRRLDEADSIEAYNAERRRQSLVEYDPRGTEASWDAYVEEAQHGRV